MVAVGTSFTTIGSVYRLKNMLLKETGSKRFDTNFILQIDAKQHGHLIMARSKIWKYYDKLDLHTAQCLLCEKIIKTCGNTSNLMKHMKTHPQIDVNDHESIVVRGILKRPPLSVKARGKKPQKFATIKRELDNNRQSDPDTAGDLDVNIIELVEREHHVAADNVENDETYAHWAAAETESATETVSAVDIIEFEPKVELDNNDQGQSQEHDVRQGDGSCETLLHSVYQDSLAYFVCRDKHPLNIIQGEGFKRMSQIICPAMRLPSTEQLSGRIAQKAHLITKQLRQQFAQLQSLSLSCVIHTTSASTTDCPEHEPSYLEVTIHYNEGNHRRARTLSIQTLPIQYNASNIVERLECVCQHFEINKSKITCIVTKSNRLLENAVAALLGNQRHVPCFAYLLEKLLLSVTEGQEFNILCDKMRSCATYQQQHLQLNRSIHALSSYELFESYVNLQQQRHSQSPLDEPPALTASELELARELQAILLPLVSAVRQLCGSSVSFYPSASKALPIAYTVLNELKQFKGTEQHQFSYNVRLFIIKQLEQRFEGLENNVHLALSTLLDPRFRNIPFQSASLLAKYMTHLYDIYEEKGATPTESTEVNKDNFDIWAAYRAFTHEKHKHVSLNGESESQDEISNYFCSSVSSLQTEPLLLWKDLSQFHPFLHGLAKKYLHIPASAVPPGRLFTAAGVALVEHHAKLMDDENITQMLLMSDCTQEEWQL